MWGKKTPYVGWGSPCMLFCRCSVGMSRQPEIHDTQQAEEGRAGLNPVRVHSPPTFPSPAPTPCPWPCLHHLDGESATGHMVKGKSRSQTRLGQEGT